MMTRSVIESDFPTINGWLAAREAFILPRSYYSDQGYIVDGVCAGFLYTTNSKVAYIEQLVTNKDATSRDRYEGIRLIAKSIIQAAAAQGVKYLEGHTWESSIWERAQELGFRVSETPFRALIYIVDEG